MTTVFCTFEVAGFHCWAGAPKEYAYLATPHRHVFKIRVDVRVVHADRDVEIIELKDTATTLFHDIADQEMLFGHPNFGSRSCEMMADELAAKLEEESIKVMSVEVSEDGENGARIYR